MARQGQYLIRGLVTDSGRNASGYANEHSDCTVRAYATAAGIEYRQAHAELFLAGRKMRKGFRFIPWARKQGWQEFPRPKMTVAKFVQFIAHTGNWIVLVRGHVFAVINGEIHDLNPAGNASKHVVMAWKVK